MDSVSKLAIEIARQTVPEEIHQSRMIAQNYIKGGKARKELFQHNKAGELGGFGGGETALLSWIFHAMGVAAPFLAGFLVSKATDNAELIKREIRSALDHNRRPMIQNQIQTDSLQHSPSSSPQDHTVPRQLQLCVEAMTQALQKVGFSPEKSKDVAYKVILVLWEEAPDASVLVHKLTERK